MQVYEAGHKDGMKAAMDEEKGGKKDKAPKQDAETSMDEAAKKHHVKNKKISFQSVWDIIFPTPRVLHGRHELQVLAHLEITSFIFI